MKKIIGREAELAILQKSVESDSPEFIAVYGRRRIGKTFLIKRFFNDQFDFYMTGSYKSTLSENLEVFQNQLKKYSGQERPKPKSWREAFTQLEEYLSTIKKDKIIVFIDELPWLDTPRSRFINALELFWNSWGDSQDKLKFIVCGSATTWMTDKLLGDKGGLHNRVNRRIYLAPFSLHETEQLLRSMGVEWDRYQIIECYMAMGGTPFYLAKIERSQSVAQNIDRLFFQRTGELRTEYDFLFRSLFKDSSIYKRVVELLAKKSVGMTREEIMRTLKLQHGGKFSEVIKNLTTCDFIREYRSFGKKERNKLYQLTDLFTLFYLKQVRENVIEDGDYWMSHIDSASHRAWSGYAFEQVCLHHVKQIKKALGISGIGTQTSSWIGIDEGKKVGQIDLIIDRRDDTINLCEMKYSSKDYDITPSYARTLVERREAFREMTKTRKALHLTMVTVYGVKHNAQWNYIQNEVTAVDLFKE